MRIITDEEKSKIRGNYPGLSVVGDVVVRGLLRFKRIHLGDRKLCPPRSEQDRQSDSFIDDSYFIKKAFICHDGTPCVWDAGRIASRAKKMGQNAVEMHVYPDKDNMLCLGHPEVVIAICKGSMINLIENLLIPYLYYQSYSEKYKEEPWPAFSHNRRIADLEALYYYPDVMHPHRYSYIDDCLARCFPAYRVGAFFQMDSLCFCGSGKIVLECHKAATKGINLLQKTFAKEKGRRR